MLTCAKADHLLSVIIVNYNVKYFLEQCLCSVKEAMKDLGGEIIVVDNASTDGSCNYLTARFPDVRFIWNRENKGFAKANNQALSTASQPYVLFLNPDTIIAEDCFTTCLQFFREHPDAGAIGVKMIDGSGRFLKESKRAYPSISTSFYKLSGLSTLFPSSKIFGRYHLGHLDQDQDHEVDVLAGAFLMCRREVLERTGGFDERFFMYGEDIDLSYRIQKLGYRNYYCSRSPIVHFKGESTRKGSLNYVKMFYRAMIIFVQKHHSGISAGLFRFLLHAGIWLRALIAAFAGFIRNNGLPLIDAVNTMFSFLASAFLWSRYVKPDVNYDDVLLLTAIPLITLVFTVAGWYTGLYDRRQERGRVIHATIFSVIITLALYSLFPEQYRFSRGMVLLGSLFSFLLLSTNRLLLRRWGWIEQEEDEKLGTVVVGSLTEYEEVLSLMQGAERKERVLGRIAVRDDGPALATLEGLDAFLRSVPVREIIFTKGAMSYRGIISKAQQMPQDLRLRLHASGSGSIVGSDSSSASGVALGAAPEYTISKPSARRFKRLFDILSSVLLMLLFPLNVFIVGRPFGSLKNACRVIVGQRTWVGYSGSGSNLPPIRRGVLGTNALPPHATPKAEAGLHLLDQMYARDYHVYRDLYLITKGYKWLGT